jgi:rfaE bifunctional protein nucleotidyltransferase chain/domain
MITVLANGCFDVLHVGHLKHLEAAKKLGDTLIVSLTLDEHVNKGPGLPIHTWEERAELLRGLRCVDEVVPSVDDCAAIRVIRPNVFVKGIDYEDSPLLDAAKAACDEVGAILVVTQTPKWSSRAIVERLVYAENHRHV